MPRLTPTLRLSLLRLQPVRPFSTATRLNAGWDGRKGDEHAINRDTLDVQSDSAKKSMKDQNEGREDAGEAQSLDRKDHGDFNKKAKETTKAPGPVIGMNDERGGVCTDYGYQAATTLIVI